MMKKKKMMMTTTLQKPRMMMTVMKITPLKKMMMTVMRMAAEETEPALPKNVAAPPPTAPPPPTTPPPPKPTPGVCTFLPFDTPDDVDVYFDGSYEEIPVPSGVKIMYKCQEGWFSSGKSWSIGKCGKDGRFDIEPLSECSTEKISKDDDKKKATKGKTHAPQQGDCEKLPFDTPEGVEVFFDNGFTEPPVPRGSQIYYHCEEGHFPDGKTWHIGSCKGGEFTISPLEECSTDKVEKPDADKPTKAKKSGVKRSPQKG